MELLDRHKSLTDEIHAYFGYVEDWCVIPLEDSRDCFWRLDGEGPGTVRFADTEEVLEDEKAEEYCEEEIYTQRYLPKWVYRGAEFTMVVVDTHVDGNKFLRIFTNANERK
jgi:hypothetical protein